MMTTRHLLWITCLIAIAVVVRAYMIAAAAPPKYPTREDILYVQVGQLKQENTALRQQVQDFYAQKRAEDNDRQDNQNREAEPPGMPRRRRLPSGPPLPPPPPSRQVLPGYRSTAIEAVTIPCKPPPPTPDGYWTGEYIPFVRVKLWFADPEPPTPEERALFMTAGEALAKLAPKNTEGRRKAFPQDHLDSGCIMIVSRVAKISKGWHAAASIHTVEPKGRFRMGPTWSEIWESQNGEPPKLTWEGPQIIW
jgi:hypothetical protein